MLAVIQLPFGQSSTIDRAPSRIPERGIGVMSGSDNAAGEDQSPSTHDSMKSIPAGLTRPDFQVNRHTGDESCLSSRLQAMHSPFGFPTADCRASDSFAYLLYLTLRLLPHSQSHLDGPASAVWLESAPGIGIGHETTSSAKRGGWTVSGRAFWPEILLQCHGLRRECSEKTLIVL